MLERLKCPTKKLPIGGILPFPQGQRVIVIGDIHGDLGELKALLKLAKVIDNYDNWIGGGDIIVHVGDTIDSCRGEDCVLPADYDKGEDLETLAYCVEIHNKAQKKGGAMYCLIGNHEIMNVKGDMSYVSPKNFDVIYDMLNNKFPGRFSDGRQARVWAFNPGNKVANFLSCSRYGVLIIGSNLFVHAGLSKELSEAYSPKEVNKILSQWLENKLDNPDEYNKLLFSGTYSPFWRRVSGKASKGLNKDNIICKDVIEAMENWKVGKIFVGHTPQLVDGINSTCDGKVWRVDVGNSATFHKFKGNQHNRQLLVITNDDKIDIINE